MVNDEDYSISISATTYGRLEESARKLGVPVEHLVDQYVLVAMREKIRTTPELRAGIKRAAMKDPSLRDLMKEILAE